MKVKSCQNCNYAHQPRGGTGTESLLVCINKFDCPGQLHLVESKDPCRNFQPKRKITRRRKPPTLNDKSIRLIPLTQGKFATVDVDDYDRFSQCKWCASKSHNNRFYAVRYKNNKTIMMHRQIMNAPAGLVVDHIDGNGLNNRKSNLRICTQAQNFLNSRPRRNCGSRYKGVSLYKREKMWRVKIFHNSRTINIGQFDDEIEAALAYDRKAAELFGEFAYLNFPTTDCTD